ncbi:flagellar filament capping protein FliD [Pseudoxanthomonas sp. PXM02]|uniref:flagellar filament capping protein FliD n=1 Tax=Pseudoxanthomonas sp. PXM02 TaxID=2769294 RepID=UPI00177B01EE|nr:flagellar filament capping protein FliD [Pseudoxanthomonas sp. PXM02]MBD9481126.1 flagellar filament capping protein FliD [Pseudoxanthomonas sp. PXM02]
MADYSLGYGGIGSGLDITGMVEQLVAADRKPADNRLNRIESQAKFKLSAIGTVSSAFSTLDTALKALKSATAFDVRTVKSGTDTVAGASVSAGTPNGIYNLEVVELATANKWITDTPVTATQTFGAGQLTLTIGGESLAIDIAEGATLQDVRGAINDVARAKGVQASVLTSNDGQYLSVSADKTGAANGFTLAFASGGSDLQSLVGSLEERVPAADAEVKIDGLTVTASTNKITEAVPGLTLDLKTKGTSTVTVSTDTAAASKLIQDFVTAYNAAITAINTSTKYNAESNEPSALTGDAQMRSAAGQLRNLMGDLLGGLAAQGLDAKTIGLQTKGYPTSDGTLVFDSSKFTAALTADPEKIRTAFTGETAFAGRLQTAVGSYVGTDGAFTLRTNGLNAQIKDVTAQRTALDARMEAVGNRYKAQFVALDSMISQMNTTSSALAQQLASLTAQTSS